MSNNVEMDDLSRLHSSKNTLTEPLQHDTATGQRANADDGSISVWAWTSAVVFVTILLVSLVVSPC